MKKLLHTLWTALTPSRREPVRADTGRAEPGPFRVEMRPLHGERVDLTGSETWVLRRRYTV